MKKETVGLSVLIALSFIVSGCDTTDEPKAQQRDVYASLQDCVADWGDTQLCEQEMKSAREHQEKMAQQRGGSGAAFVPVFFGPSYYGNERAVYRNGTTVAPSTNRSSRMVSYRPNPGGGRIISYSAPAKPTPSIRLNTTTRMSSGTSRGGFGKTGGSRGGFSGA